MAPSQFGTATVSTARASFPAIFQPLWSCITGNLRSSTSATPLPPAKRTKDQSCGTRSMPKCVKKMRRIPRLHGVITAFYIATWTTLPSIAMSFLVPSSSSPHNTPSTLFMTRSETSSLTQWDGELSDEDEAMIELIRGPMGAATPRPRPKSILVLSDTTGVTAKAAVEKCLAQFNGCDERFVGTQALETYDEDDDDEDEDCENLTTRMYPFLRDGQEISELIRRAAERSNVLVVFTFANPQLRATTCRMCDLVEVRYVDLLGPMFDALSTFTDQDPQGFSFTRKQKRRKVLSEDYFRRIEAIEFTLKCDDGRNTRLLPEADVVILGVSRTGKTPLSVYLSQTMEFKVANVPLVVDIDPPSFKGVNPKRVFCLTLGFDDLSRIRKSRMERELGSMKETNNYAKRKYIREDLRNAQQLVLEHGFTEIDITGRAVEETASQISSLLNDRFGDTMYSSKT